MKSISSIAARGSWLANCLASWLAKWNPGRPVIALMWGFLPALATQLHSGAVTPTGSNTLTEQSGSLLGSFTPPGPAINTTGGSGQLIRPEIGGATVGLVRLHVGSNGRLLSLDRICQKESVSWMKRLLSGGQHLNVICRRVYESSIKESFRKSSLLETTHYLCGLVCFKSLHAVLNNKTGNIVCFSLGKKKSKQHTKTNNELSIVFNSLLVSVIDLYYLQTVSLGTLVSLNSIQHTPFSCHKHSPVHQVILRNAQFSSILVRNGFSLF